MQIELINTGSELMLGFVLNTHQQWLCRQLSDRGYLVSRQTAIADEARAIQAAVGEALFRADLVLVTGGLGPTSDDLTRNLIAELAGRTLREDPEVLARIEQFFALRGRPMPAAARVQAQIPEGALVLPNACGTAPGLVLEFQPSPHRSKEAAPHQTFDSPLPLGGGEGQGEGAVPGKSSWLIMLPGPTNELRPMFTTQVVPLLHRLFPLATTFACRTLKTTGLGEALVQERIAGPLQSTITAGLQLHYCARPSEVDVRLIAQGNGADQLVHEAEAVVRARIGEFIFGTDETTLEREIIQQLTRRKQTVALAESCTGGGLAHRLTNVPGASAVLLAGLVTYANSAKEKLLGVRSETLATHGAVSEATAREMAAGARLVTGADYALSVTGIAGPTGGTDEKPVGTVFIGLATPEEIRIERRLNPFARETFKQVTSQQALELLRRALL